MGPYRVNRAMARIQAAGENADDAALHDVLDLLLPGLAVLDAGRVQFRRAAERADWAWTYRSALATALSAATRLDDADLVAQLVETRLNVGTLDVGAQQRIAVPLDGPDRGARDPWPEGRLHVGAGRLISGAGRRVGLPPRLRMPDGAVALADYLELAESRYGMPVTSDHVVDVDWSKGRAPSG